MVRIQSSAALGHGLAGHRTLRSVSWVRAVSTNAASAALKKGAAGDQAIDDLLDLGV